LNVRRELKAREKIEKEKKFEETFSESTPKIINII